MAGRAMVATGTTPPKNSSTMDSAAITPEKATFVDSFMASPQQQRIRSPPMHSQQQSAQ